MISTIAAWSNAETLHLQKPTARLCTSDWCNHTFFWLWNTRPGLNIKAEVSIQKPAWLLPCCQPGPALAWPRPLMIYRGKAAQTRAVTTFPFSSYQRFFPIVSKIFDGQLSFYCERIALNRIFCREGDDTEWSKNHISPSAQAEMIEGDDENGGPEENILTWPQRGF